MSKSLRTLASALTLLLVSGVLCWSQQPPSQPNSDNMAELRQEVDQLKKTVTSLEERLTAQDKKEGEAQPADGAHLLADQSSPVAPST